MDATRAARITERAAQLRMTAMLVSLLAMPFVALGWIAYRVVAGVRWIVAAVVTGYVDARESSRAG